MKVRAKIRYPYIIDYTDEIEIDVPDDEDVDEWIYDNAVEILRDDGCTDFTDDEIIDMLDCDTAYVKVLEEK
jgi:hypothetical protein